MEEGGGGWRLEAVEDVGGENGEDDAKIFDSKGVHVEVIVLPPFPFPISCSLLVHGGKR